MVLVLKHWKSRSPPGIEAGVCAGYNPFTCHKGRPAMGGPFWRFSRSGRSQEPGSNAANFGAAGWSSPVARQAHNLKVVGSNPTPATNAIELTGFLLEVAGLVYVRSMIPTGFPTTSACARVPSI